MAESEIQSKPFSGFKILSIGAGQGGSRVAYRLGTEFKQANHCVFLNTSNADIEGLEGTSKNRNIKVGDYNVEGTGKDRSVATALLRADYPVVVDQLVTYVAEEKYDFIYIFFSTSGGTGSGFGPLLTALLTSEEFLSQDAIKTVYKDKIPIVYGIALTPEIGTNEGNLSLENTLECLEEINKYVAKDFCRFIIANNGAFNFKQHNGKRSDQFEYLNSMITKYIYRYLNIYGHSRIANLDRADRLGAMQVMGIHSFGTLDTDGSKGPTPFFIPEGERVRKITYEVPESVEDKVLHSFQSAGILCDDYIHGLYDESNNENIMPIISYNGFKNTAKIAEVFANRLQLNKELAKKVEKENIGSAFGLDKVQEERDFRQKEYTAKSAKSFKDIFAALN
jgi:cell division GTPase FtsZ